jgi:hypothetical protein
MKHDIWTLEGPLLDAAVAIAEGLPFSRIQDGIAWLHLTDLRSGSVRECPCFSSRWADGGPIIERESITLQRLPSCWAAAVAVKWSDDEAAESMKGGADGPTALIAAMRAYVDSKLDGGPVDLP